MHGGGKPPGGVATGDENLRPYRKHCQWLLRRILKIGAGVLINKFKALCNLFHSGELETVVFRLVAPGTLHQFSAAIRADVFHASRPSLAKSALVRADHRHAM